MQSVRFSNVASEAVVLDKEVPKGSTLGLLLFLLYVNNVCDQMIYI